MAASVLLDTNVLVYAYDVRDRAKQDRALALVGSLAQTERGAISTQVLGEFVSVTTSGRRRFLTIEEARARIEHLADAFEVLIVTPRVVFDAVWGMRRYQISYWDAQLWATARLNQVPVLLTEDLQNGQTLEGVRFLDPFRPTFDIDSLLTS